MAFSTIERVVVDRLVEVARTSQLRDFIASYTPPTGTGIALEDVSRRCTKLAAASGPRCVFEVVT